MNLPQRNNRGFSAVELLISLFIAAAFIMTGYQLFVVVMKDGDDARLRSRASNIAYESLRKYAANATNPCTVRPNVTPTAPTDLPAASVAVTFTCPYGTTSSTTRVQAVVSYGSETPKQTVTEVMYVTK